jgi:hypothetical protein
MNKVKDFKEVMT